MRLAGPLQRSAHMWCGHMTDVDIVSHGPVEEPVEDTQNLLTPESQDQDERDSDTDDGAVGGDQETDGSLTIITFNMMFKNKDKHI